MKLYCDKCKKLIITEADNCIVCLNNQLKTANAKIEKIKELLKKYFDDEFIPVNDIKQIIESEE